jgi:transcription antitermination factor NusG
MSKQEFKPNEVAHIRTGKFAGLAGTVTDTKPDTKMVRVHIEGVRDGQAITAHVWLKAGQLEHNA